MRNFYELNDGRFVTDLDVEASELWAVIGPKPLVSSTQIIQQLGLPAVWKWLTDEQWSELEFNLRRQLTNAQAYQLAHQKGKLK